MRFSESFLNDIRDRVPISSVIGSRVTWDRKKTNTSRGDWWACCPFHGENTPSFHCEDQKGRYHCFGCGVTGDHFRFLTELDGLSFPEAVERMADMAGVPMPARDPEAEAREEKRATLYDVMELATKFFEDKLQGADGAKARAYLRERGITSATLENFRVGFAPDSRNALKEFLAGKGVEKEKIEACGLVVFGPDIAVSYDRFRDRIMFPIANPRGQIIAFGGRALSPDVPAKYLNSPETDLFHKGNVLYNLGPAREAARKAGTLIAVEGYMDVIALTQAGIENVVAPLGTALTEVQLKQLWRIADDPILSFDGDEAGLRAAHRVVDLAFPNLTLGKSLKFCILPNGKDPDDIVSQGNADEFIKFLKDASPLREFFIERRWLESRGDTPEQKATFEKSLHRDVDQIPDVILKKYYRSHLKLRVVEYVGGKTNNISRREVRKIKVEIDSNRLVATILGICVEYPMLIPDYIDLLIRCEESIDSEPYKLFAHEVYRLYVENDEILVTDIYDKIDKRFFAVLNAVHGDAYEKPIRDKNGNVLEYRPVPRGHRLTILFPKLRVEPPLELVQHTLNFLFEKLHLTIVQAEYLSRIKEMDEEAFSAYQAEIIEKQAALSKAEIELDESYQVYDGRKRYAA